MSSTRTSGGSAPKLAIASAPEAVARTVYPARASASRTTPRSSSLSSQTPARGPAMATWQHAEAERRLTAARAEPPKSALERQREAARDDDREQPRDGERDQPDRLERHERD